MSDESCRVLVLGSGAGSNFEALAEAADRDYTIVAAGADRPEAPMLVRARRRSIPTFALAPQDFPNRAAHDRALAAAIGRAAPDLIALAGYMRILGPAVLAGWVGRMLNIHPSLLPEFPGLDTHERALAARSREHGATVHFVTPELDAGPGVLQGRLALAREDTPVTLAARVLRLEHRIYPVAVRWFAAGRLSMRNGGAWLDGDPLITPRILDEADLCN